MIRALYHRLSFSDTRTMPPASPCEAHELYAMAHVARVRSLFAQAVGQASRAARENEMMRKCCAMLAAEVRLARELEERRGR